MSALERSSLGHTAATTIGWALWLVVRVVFLLPSRLLAWLLRGLARPLRGLWGAPVSEPVQELAGILTEKGPPAAALKQIATQSRASDVVGIVRGRILREGRGRRADPERALPCELVRGLGRAHDLDTRLLAAYDTPTHEADAPPVDAKRLHIAELGLAGVMADYPSFPPRSLPLDAAVSAWLPGGDPAAARAWLDGLEREGHPFRLLVPELIAPAAAEAARLFRKGAVGTQVHTLLRVRAHPERLVDRARAAAPGGWLDEPVLNRLAALCALGGAARDVRVVASHRQDEALAVVVLLRHERPGRLSILELVVSSEALADGQPAVYDDLELTGRDGLIRVSGVLEGHGARPRLSLHRGPLEQVRRDLPRGPDAFAHAAATDRAWARRPDPKAYAFARTYLDTCDRTARACRPRSFLASWIP